MNITVIILAYLFSIHLLSASTNSMSASSTYLDDDFPSPLQKKISTETLTIVCAANVYDLELDIQDECSTAVPPNTPIDLSSIANDKIELLNFPPFEKEEGSNNSWFKKYNRPFTPTTNLNKHFSFSITDVTKKRTTPQEESTTNIDVLKPFTINESPRIIS